jgi:hypothetical protein
MRMSKLAGRPWSPAGYPSTFRRSKSTTALPALSETAEADMRHVEVVEKRTQLQGMGTNDFITVVC